MNVHGRRGIPIGAWVLAGAVLAAGLTGPEPARAHSDDWAAPFMGGIMAGHLLSGLQQQRREQTEAMQEMARGGGGFGGYGGGYGGGRGYGPPRYGPRPEYGAPPPMSPEQQLQQLNQLAAGGYITPEQYRERRQAILNGM